MNYGTASPSADAHSPALSGAEAARLLSEAVSAVFRAIFARRWILGPLGLVLYLRLNRMRRSLEALFAALAAMWPIPVPFAPSPAAQQSSETWGPLAGSPRGRHGRVHRRRLAVDMHGEAALAVCDRPAAARVSHRGTFVVAGAGWEAAPRADRRPAGGFAGSTRVPFLKSDRGCAAVLRLNCFGYVIKADFRDSSTVLRSYGILCRAKKRGQRHDN